MNIHARRRLRQIITVLLMAIAMQSGATEWAHKAVRRNVQFDNLSTEHGLSSEFVQDVIQDGQGYMWFATQGGLNRFDGHDIRVYEHRVKDPRSLSNSFIWSLHVDEQGTLWVGTDRGVNKYDASTDSFIREPIDGISLRGIRVRKITQDAKGWFWIGSLGEGLIGLDPENGKLFKYKHDPDDPGSLPNNHVIDILEDRRGQIWVGTDGGGLARLDRATHKFIVYRHQPGKPLSLSGDRIRSIYEDKSGRLWIGTAHGLNLFDPATGRFRRFQHDPEDPQSLGKGQVPSIFEDARGTLWVGTESGLSEWRPSMDGFVHYRSDASDRYSLAGDRVNAMVQDASGVLWLATHGGVSAWNYFSDTFSYYSSSGGFLENNQVTAVAETSDGVLWVATYGGGLSSINLASDAVHHFHHDPNDPSSLGDERVMTVHVDHEDTVWVGTRDDGLSRLNGDGDSFTHFRFDPNDAHSLSGNAISCIFSEKDGTLWVGVFGGGLNRMSRQGKPEFERFQHDPEDDTSLSSDRVLTIHQDHTGALWIGTEGAGLNRFDHQTNRFERFDIDNTQALDGENPVSGTPWEIHETHDGTLWIGTLGQGLLRWSAVDRAAGTLHFEQFAAAEGLASEIYGVVEGAAGELWLSSSRGLFRFEPDSGAVRKFDRKNGLRNQEFNQGARLRSRSGRVLFGGTGGLVGFYPGEVKNNTSPPPIALLAKSRTEVISRLLVGQSTPTVSLEYLDSFVSFEFVALDFVSPDKNEYRYRLRGFDNVWSEVQGFRRAIYTSLPTGEYTFEVQASNNDGIWNREGVSMQVHVIPPPWRTWWAYLAYILAVLGLIVWYIRKQNRKHNDDAELRARLKQLVSERTAALADRNDELESLNQQLADASVTDELTGLYNRRYVDGYIEAEASQMERSLFIDQRSDQDDYQNQPPKVLFLMMVDLDGFKLINDTFGHHAGDRALIEVKNRLTACCRKADVVVRWGGDEFLIIGQALTFDGSKVLAEKLRRSLAESSYNLGNGNIGRLSASIGITAIPFVESKLGFGTWEQMVVIADQCTYLAKSNGRNAWVSIRGTDLLAINDLQAINNNLAILVEAGKLVIDSSVEGGVSLYQGDQLKRIEAN